MPPQAKAISTNLNPAPAIISRSCSWPATKSIFTPTPAGRTGSGISPPLLSSGSTDIRKIHESEFATMFIVSCLVFCVPCTGGLAGGLLQDLDAAAGADAGRASLHHTTQVGQGTDATRSLHLELLLAHDSAH